jgi:hypothetical protein
MTEAADKPQLLLRHQEPKPPPCKKKSTNGMPTH